MSEINLHVSCASRKYLFSRRLQVITRQGISPEFGGILRGERECECSIDEAGEKPLFHVDL